MTDALPTAWTRFAASAWPAADGRETAVSWEPIAADGSDRRFIRLRTGSETAIFLYGPDPKENRAYEAIGRHLWRFNGCAPEILAVDRDNGLFLLEDVGPVSLREAYGNSGIRPYRAVIDLLADLQERGLDGFDPTWCHQTPRYDAKLVVEREIRYFLTAFVQGYLNLDIPAAGFEPEAWSVAEAAAAGETVLIHRDFQSRNIHVRDGRPRLLDFQGARLGPPGYDLASLLYDPYVGLGEPERSALLEAYLERRRNQNGFDARSFLKTYPLLAACRLMQALGAYGYLTVIKGKMHFESHIPAALDTLAGLWARPELSPYERIGRLIGGLAGRSKTA